MKKLLTLVMVLAMAGGLFAQISFKGDVQVRPRLDIKDKHAYGDKKTDGYYMYRTRINMSAKIGDGWYAKARLSHYNYAEYGFTNGLEMDAIYDDYTDTGKINKEDLHRRNTVAFTQMVLGLDKEKWGFKGGILPFNGLANPMLDVHYFPTKMVDIPWTIHGLGSRFGFAGYVKAGPGKINVSATLDANFFTLENAGAKNVDNHDTYTFGFDYALKVAGIGIQPAVYYTWASSNMSAPMTYGVNLTSPKFAGFSVGATAALTSNSVDNTSKYDGSFFRIKLGGKVGPGSISAWYDLAKRTDKGATDVDHDYSYLWLMYKYKAYSGDHGAVILAPRYRLLTEKVSGSKDYSRQKIEFLVIATFK